MLEITSILRFPRRVSTRKRKKTGNIIEIPPHMFKIPAALTKLIFHTLVR